MRKLLGTLVGVVLVVGGCSSGSDQPAPDVAATTEAPTPTRDVTLDSLNLDWPRSGKDITFADPPDVPDAFNTDVFEQMVVNLKAWATTSTVDEDVWHSRVPLDQVAEGQPAKTAETLRTQSAEQASPRLAVANVFSDRVAVIGSPLVTTAWQVRTVEDDTEEPYVVLELQTRAAYEVRLGDNGPSRVIGVLRVHSMSAFADSTDDFGVSSGWQEFGAGDCTLALDDSLIPDADVEGAETDLKKFIEVGSQKDVVMPDLGDDEQVDSNYLKRCRQGSI